METRFYTEMQNVLNSNRSLLDKYTECLSLIHEIRMEGYYKRRELHSDYSSISQTDLELRNFYMSWRKYPGLGVPREKYLNVIEKILGYAKMIIETKCEDYKTLPGMSEFLEESDRQYEEIVTNDPELSALRNDPYGL